MKISGLYWPIRRTGSNIVVLDGESDTIKKLPDDIKDNHSMVMMLSGDGSHREMAVDVPDSFAVRSPISR
ncbi:hypothetical protein WA026_016591 [Henosepilachna vigintioctopunctata]|uniref:Uncharacterized protein n=1 Tax=Henosepilachna vigintioctopunctata TaxID=420089 RepID=A0AAW1VDH7_9CUCU